MTLGDLSMKPIKLRLENISCHIRASPPQVMEFARFLPPFLGETHYPLEFAQIITTALDIFSQAKIPTSHFSDSLTLEGQQRRYAEIIRHLYLERVIRAACHPEYAQAVIDSLGPTHLVLPIKDRISYSGDYSGN